MNVKKGIALGWSHSRKALQLVTPDGKRIEIPQSEFSVHDFTAPKGLPFEVAWLMGKEVYYVELENGIYSRKRVMQKTIYNMVVGEIFEATVIKFCKKGLFVEYNNCFFYCSIFEVSNSFVKDVSDHFYIGQKVDVRLLDKGSKYKYPEVSYKQAFPDCLDNYHSGDYCVCKVSNLSDHLGAYFMEVSPAVPGIMDFENCPKWSLPLHYGDEVLCVVKNVNSKGVRLIGLRVSRRANQ